MIKSELCAPIMPISAPAALLIAAHCVDYEKLTASVKVTIGELFVEFYYQNGNLQDPTGALQSVALTWADYVQAKKAASDFLALNYGENVLLYTVDNASEFKRIQAHFESVGYKYNDCDEYMQWLELQAQDLTIRITCLGDLYPEEEEEEEE